MSGQITLEGNLTAGSPGCGCSFPGGSSTVPLAFSPSPKQSVVRSGPDVRMITSAVYVDLLVVGATGTVTKANTAYLKVNSPMMIRATYDNTPDPDIVSEFPLSGTWIIEPGDTKYLKKVEVKGSGSVEFLVSGNQ